MNEMAVNSSTYMYDEVSEINQLNKVEGFDPRKYMRLIQNEGQAGKYYLDVAYRKLWFYMRMNRFLSISLQHNFILSFLHYYVTVQSQADFHAKV